MGNVFGTVYRNEFVIKILQHSVVTQTVCQANYVSSNYKLIAAQTRIVALKRGAGVFVSRCVLAYIWTLVLYSLIVHIIPLMTASVAYETSAVKDIYQLFIIVVWLCSVNLFLLKREWQPSSHWQKPNARFARISRGLDWCRMSRCQLMQSKPLVPFVVYVMCNDMNQS